MKNQSVVKAIAIDLDDIAGEAEACFDDGRIDEDEVMVLRLFVCEVKTRAGWLYEHDSQQKAEMKRMIYGDDSSMNRRAAFASGELAKAA